MMFETGQYVLVTKQEYNGECYIFRGKISAVFNMSNSTSKMPSNIYLVIDLDSIDSANTTCFPSEIEIDSAYYRDIKIDLLL